MHAAANEPGNQAAGSHIGQEPDRRLVAYWPYQTVGVPHTGRTHLLALIFSRVVGSNVPDPWRTIHFFIFLNMLNCSRLPVV